MAVSGDACFGGLSERLSAARARTCNGRRALVLTRARETTASPGRKQECRPRPTRRSQLVRGDSSECVGWDDRIDMEALVSFARRPRPHTGHQHLKRYSARPAARNASP